MNGRDEPRLLALFDAACALACAEYQVPRHDLAWDRSKRGNQARGVAMYLMRINGMTLEDVGNRMGGRDRATVRQVLNTIEDRRDEPGFDALLDNLDIILQRRVAEIREGGT